MLAWTRSRSSVSALRCRDAMEPLVRPVGAGRTRWPRSSTTTTAGRRHGQRVPAGRKQYRRVVNGTTNPISLLTPAAPGWIIGTRHLALSRGATQRSAHFLAFRDWSGLLRLWRAELRGQDPSLHRRGTAPPRRRPRHLWAITTGLCRLHEADRVSPLHLGYYEALARIQLPESSNDGHATSRSAIATAKFSTASPGPASAEAVGFDSRTRIFIIGGVLRPPRQGRPRG